MHTMKRYCGLCSKIHPATRFLWCAGNVAALALFLFSPSLGAQDIHSGALANDIDAVRRALGADADANSYNLSGFAPLHSAARSGNVDIARLLVENGANVNIRADKDKGRNEDTPLHLATFNGHVDMVNFLLKSGANPNAKNSFGQTPLADARVTLNAEMIRLLIRRGANPDVVRKIVTEQGADAELLSAIDEAATQQTAGGAELGLSILYVNDAPFAQPSAKAETWSTITGNIRAGIIADAVWGIGDSPFGMGLNVGILLGVGSVPDTDGTPTIIIDIPIRAAMRIAFGDRQYIQAQAGILLQISRVDPDGPETTDSDGIMMNTVDGTLRFFIDVGLRLKLNWIGFDAGYLFHVASGETTAEEILPGSGAPFYVGVYIPIVSF